MMEKARKIQIHDCSGRYYVWNVEDIFWLRSEARIIGSFVGCLPQLSHQNSQLGPPLLLSTEEATLLIKNEVAHFVRIQRPSPLTDSDKMTFKELYEDWIVATKLQYEQERLEKINQLADKIVQAKLDSLRKLEKDGQLPQDVSHIEKLGVGAMRASSSKRKFDDMDEEGEEGSATFELTWKQEKQVDNAESIESISIPNRDEIVSREMSKISRSLDSSNTGPNSLTRIFVECPMKDWNMPINEGEHSDPLLHQRLLNATFSYIHSRGYFVTRATKFGCHFLVYEGDPSIYHSKYMIYCLSDSNKALPALQLVNIARLATTVKKQLLIAKWTEEKVPKDAEAPISKSDLDPCFFMLEWKGNYNARRVFLEGLSPAAKKRRM